MILGLISDTHNLLRPEALATLKGADAILHAGDINSQQILDQLQTIAPVYAVRGNADKEWAEHLPPFLDFELGGLRIYMTHKKKDLPPDLSPYDLVLIGHSHQYLETRQGSTLIVNPGSCGPRRFHQPITLARTDVADKEITVTRIDIAHPVRQPKIDPRDIAAQIEVVIKEVEKGRGAGKISEKYGMDPMLVEQIVRLYLTYPGVTVDGIMAKMGL